MRTLLLVGAVASLALLGCGGDGTDAGTAPDLTGSSWVLSYYTAPGAEATEPTAAAAGESTLTFLTDSEASGSTGCNRFGATWTQDGSGLSIEMGPMTLMACIDPDVTSQEQALLALLPEVATFAQTDDTLSLRDADGDEVLTYRAGISDLAGTSWAATGINNQTGGVEGTAATADVTADFADDGSMSGFTGCRDYTAQWTVTDGEIAITDVVFVGDECSGEQAALEDDYFQALVNAATFQLEGSTLNLRDDEGATQVTFAST